MKKKKYCGNCRWYVNEKLRCRMDGEEHKETERGCWWHDFKDKELRGQMGADRIFGEGVPGKVRI